MQKKINRGIAVYNHFGENIVTNPKLVLAHSKGKMVK